mgnify:FL=1
MDSTQLEKMTTLPYSGHWCGDVASCANQTWWHIPGPNPILTSTGFGFDKIEIEQGGVGILPSGAMYLIYHGDTMGSDYQTGIAFAETVHSPFVKSPANPIVPYAPSSSGDESRVVGSRGPRPISANRSSGASSKFDEGLAACGHLASNASHWLLFYCGGWGVTGPSVGLATALIVASTLHMGLDGPWSKIYLGADGADAVIDSSMSTDNAALGKKWRFLKDADGFYVGSLAQGPHTGGELWMYAESPVGTTDQGPIALWTSKSGAATGPWAKKGFAILPGNDSAAWNWNGFSETGVHFDETSSLWWSAFSGAQQQSGCPKPWPRPAASPSGFRSRSRRGGEGRLEVRSEECEMLGLAFSSDGLAFVPSNHNPIVRVADATPFTAAMAEGHIVFDPASTAKKQDQPQLIRIFHTIRWEDSGLNTDGEDLGVEYLSATALFNVSGLRVVAATDTAIAKVAAGATTKCAWCGQPCRGDLAYCPAIKSIITAQGEEGMYVNASVGFSVEAACDAAEESVRVTLNVHSSASGRQYPDASAVPTTTIELSAVCGVEGSVLRLRAAPRPLSGGAWHRITLTNRGTKALLNVTVLADIVGTEPTRLYSVGPE